MVLGLDEANKLHIKLAKMTKEELETMFDKKLGEQNDLRFPVKKIKKEILAFLDEPTLITGSYNQATTFISLYDNVKGGKDIDVLEVRQLQRFLVESKYNCVEQARLVSGLLKSIMPINRELGALEETVRHIADYIEKIRLKEETGMEFNEEDAKNQATIRENNAKIEGKKAPVKATKGKVTGSKKPKMDVVKK